MEGGGGRGVRESGGMVGGTTASTSHEKHN